MKSTEYATLAARSSPLEKPEAQRALLGQAAPNADFDRALREGGLGAFERLPIEIFQINVGKLCNQTCRHCHVDAGPDRKEIMTRPTMERCLDAAGRLDAGMIDITGGAPEMNPDFRWLVSEAAQRGFRVMVRCNLTYLNTRAGADLPELFAQHRIEVVASLPCYGAPNADLQRGDGVFDKSIKALQTLNGLGYGQGELKLTLVANPIGDGLAADQAALERDYKARLEADWGIVFDRLFVIANMPIARHLAWLEQNGSLETYMTRLVEAFNPTAAAGAMCRTTLNVGWDGKLYDCDFNQMLEMELDPPLSLESLQADALAQRPILTDRHCFACAAGAGSSCGGATAGS